MNTPQPVALLDNIALTVMRPTAALEKYLSFTEKSIELVEDDRGFAKRQIVYNKRKLFNVLSERSPRVIQTHQGFWQEALRILLASGAPPKFQDLRYKCKPPDLGAMHGFRFSQRTLLETALRQERSGLVGAPTRYGKTYLILNTLRAYHGVTTVVAVPGIDLVRQTYDAVKEAFPLREVKLMGGGSRVKVPSEDITVCSMDSLHKCDTGKTELLLIDEPHSAVTDSRWVKIVAFSKARIIGYGATLEGRFDGRDKVITGLIGPVLSERTYTEAVAEGAICPLVVLFLRIPLKKTTKRNRDAVYNEFFFRSPRMAKMVARICRGLIPAEWQTIVFIKNEKQALQYLGEIGEEGTIAMAKRMTPKVRKEMMANMAAGTVKRCLATDIYAQGVTFHNVRALVNAAGGGNNTTAIQKPGRLAELMEGKSHGIVFDFLFTNEDGGDTLDSRKFLINDSVNRRKAYEDKGYIVHECEDAAELKIMFERYSK